MDPLALCSSKRKNREFFGRKKYDIYVEIADFFLQSSHCIVLVRSDGTVGARDPVIDFVFAIGRVANAPTRRSRNRVDSSAIAGYVKNY